MPVAQSEPGPPDPGPIEQPAATPAGHQYYPGRDTRAPPHGIPRNIPDPAEDDGITGVPAPRGKRTAAAVTVAVPLRSHEVLAWAADASGMTLDAYLVQVLAGVAASMRPQFRQAKTGRVGGSVRAGELGKFTA